MTSTSGHSPGLATQCLAGARRKIGETRTHCLTHCCGEKRKLQPACLPGDIPSSFSATVSRPIGTPTCYILYTASLRMNPSTTSDLTSTTPDAIPWVSGNADCCSTLLPHTTKAGDQTCYYVPGCCLVALEL